ncbi:MAG: hypothetical protein H7A01_17400 [Hahellaceae bacterium]|nr:hypothetical protein [Hahellaceae bacterium]MCP5212084.1 hypothetical protein [Hahellaceae bacterium]
MAEQKYKVMPGAVAGESTFGSKVTGKDASAQPLMLTKGKKSASAQLEDKVSAKQKSGIHIKESDTGAETNEGIPTAGVESPSNPASDTVLNDIGEKKKQQARKLRLMKECEGVLLVNYDWLDMPDYPSNDLLAVARKTREYTILLNTCLGILCVLAFSGVLPAWVGGSALGLLFISFCVSFTSLRKVLIKEPSYKEIMKERQVCEFKALGHIRLLEGKSGLAWKLENLAPYNSALKKDLFQSIVVYSRAQKLLKILRRKEHIRLYLIYLLEAEKAFKRLKEDYFSTHRELQSRGIDDTL